LFCDNAVMKRVRRFGMYWWRVSEKETEAMAPRILAFILAVPLLVWLLTRLLHWMFLQ
jgi:hypothetical protein